MGTKSKSKPKCLGPNTSMPLGVLQRSIALTPKTVTFFPLLLALLKLEWPSHVSVSTIQMRSGQTMNCSPSSQLTRFSFLYQTLSSWPS